MSNHLLYQLGSDALTHYLRDRLCLIASSTGNLVSAKGRHFIVTCHHVAEQFFADSKNRKVVTRYNHPIMKDELELVASFNGDLDIALIEIKKVTLDCPTYTMDNFLFKESYDAEDFQKTNIMICGNPFDLSKLTGERRGFTPLTFTTLPDSTRFPFADFIFAQYQTDGETIENKTGLPITLPSAKGLSGAFMLTQREFDGPKEAIWTPELMKVVAIQNSWLAGEYVKGTNVKYLLKMLEQCGAA